MALDLAAVGGSVLIFQALYWLAHVVSKTFVLKYGAMTVYDRNQVCQFVCSFVKGSAICCLCYPIAWRNGEAFLKADSLDGAVNNSDMQLPLYLFLGYTSYTNTPAHT